MRLVRLAVPLLIVIAALAALAAAFASARPHLSAQRSLYAVTVDGVSTIAWHYQDPNYPQECATWSYGQGTQKSSISSSRPSTWEAIVISGGHFEPQLGPRGEVRVKGRVQRGSHRWESHATPSTPQCTGCGPLSEYGPCVPDDSNLVPPLFSCESKPLATYVEIEGGGEGGDFATVTWRQAPDYRNCPPTQEGGPGFYGEGQPLPLGISHGQERQILGLRRGATATLRLVAVRGFSEESGRTTHTCSKPGAGNGYSECAKTTLTLRFRRTR